MIDELPFLAPDASRTAATTTRCHGMLTARRRRTEAQNRPNPRVIVAERLVATGLCVIYLISMAGNLVSVAGLR